MGSYQHAIITDEEARCRSYSIREKRKLIMGVNSPAEITEIWINNGIKKANLSVGKMLVLGMLAGAYIGFGANVFVLATAAGGDPFQSMVAKLIGAALFPVGLMMVILCGAELFTGNNLLTLALMDKKITAGKMLKNWVIVYIGNLIGSVLLAFVLAKSGLFADAAGERAMAIAASKTSIPFMPAVLRGIGCNVLVVLACWLQAGAKDMIGKIFAIWFPIMMFVFAGFEHSVANMTYIPLGIFLGADVSWGAFFLANLVPVTIGNLIGGAVVIPFAYYYAYKK
jgi:formate/nitrite transporter